MIWVLGLVSQLERKTKFSFHKLFILFITFQLLHCPCFHWKILENVNKRLFLNFLHTDFKKKTYCINLRMIEFELIELDAVGYSYLNPNFWFDIMNC